MQRPNIVSQNEWLKARTALLLEEKEFTRLRDQLSQKRRQLPWVMVDKNYSFEGMNGTETLSDLFDGRSQLIVYHFMYGPDWEDACPSCSFWADNFNGIDIHLKHRDTSLVAISRASLDQLQAYSKRMGWDFKWLSSSASEFNYDFQASFRAEEMEQGDVFYNF